MRLTQSVVKITAPWSVARIANGFLDKHNSKAKRIYENTYHHTYTHSQC